LGVSISHSFEATLTRLVMERVRRCFWALLHHLQICWKVST